MFDIKKLTREQALARPSYLKDGQLMVKDASVADKFSDDFVKVAIKRNANGQDHLAVYAILKSDWETVSQDPSKSHIRLATPQDVPTMPTAYAI